MAINYAEVLQELENQEARAMAELQEIRAAKPAIEALMRRNLVSVTKVQERKKYDGLGVTASIRELFESTSELLTRDKVYDRLKENGWTSKSADEMNVVSSTLSRLVVEQYLEKIEDRWRRKGPTQHSHAASSESELLSLQ